MKTKEEYGIEELAKVGPWGRTYLFQAIKEKRLIAQKAWRTIITHENDQAFLRSLPVSEGKERAREHPPAAAPTPASGGLLETLGNPCDGRGWADAKWNGTCTKCRYLWRCHRLLCYSDFVVEAESLMPCVCG